MLFRGEVGGKVFFKSRNKYICIACHSYCQKRTSHPLVVSYLTIVFKPYYLQIFIAGDVISMYCKQFETVFSLQRHC